MATSLLHRIQRRANLTTPLLALHPKGRASWPFHCCTAHGVQGSSAENETMMRGNLGHPKMHKTEASVWGVRAISKFYGLFFYEGEWFSMWCSTNKKFQWPNGTYSKQSTSQHF